jgi:hypothetical protein
VERSKVSVTRVYVKQCIFIHNCICAVERPVAVVMHTLGLPPDRMMDKLIMPGDNCNK